MRGFALVNPREDVSWTGHCFVRFAIETRRIEIADEYAAMTSRMRQHRSDNATRIWNVFS
jgi:hypothetical protein